MEIIKGYSNSERIQGISGKILNLYNDIHPNNPRKSFLDVCGKYEKNCFLILFSCYDRLLGMVCCGKNNTNDNYEFYNFGVRKYRRNEGIGRALLYNLKLFTKGKMYSHVSRENFTLRSYYTYMGYSLSDKDDEYLLVSLWEHF
tara:strand:+ start:466 stop:897 length:432 start_codon:yes stop_codon:yes gene_type:complete